LISSLGSANAFEKLKGWLLFAEVCSANRIPAIPAEIFFIHFLREEFDFIGKGGLVKRMLLKFCIGI
jgi:hypothetical protein